MELVVSTDERVPTFSLVNFARVARDIHRSIQGSQLYDRHGHQLCYLVRLRREDLKDLLRDIDSSFNAAVPVADTHRFPIARNFARKNSPLDFISGRGESIRINGLVFLLLPWASDAWKDSGPEGSLLTLELLNNRYSVPQSQLDR